MIVTTNIRPDEATVQKARQLARELDAVYVERRNRTLAALARMHGTDRIVVVGAADIRVLSGQAPPFFFHPSMALVRVRRLRHGERDALVDVAGVRPGDAVLDCTAGLGADAIVLSYAVGEQGRVTALEVSPVLHAVVREGLATYVTGEADIDAAMRRIETRRADYSDVLPRLPDKSYDIVYFDPMFRIPVRSSSALEPLRAFAEKRPLAEEDVRHAIRVARRRVVLKDHRDSGEFERLGFAIARKSSSPVAYGVIDCDAT